MGNGDNNSVNKEMRKIGFQEQRRLFILKCEQMIRKLVPCTTDKILAEIQYETGMTDTKAKEILGIFIKREIVSIEDRDGEKVLVINDGNTVSK